MLPEQAEYLQSILDTIRDPIVALDKALQVDFANRAFYLTFNVDAPTTEGRLIYELGNGQWNVPALRRLLEEILPPG